MSPHPPTPEEEVHVINVLQSLYQYVETSNIDLNLDGYRLNRSEGIMLGSIHDKWFSCLQPCIAKGGIPYTKYLWPPSNVPQPLLVVHDKEWVVSQLAESDIELVRSTSHVPRSREYLLSRCPTSVCVRMQEGGRPIAWVLLHSDGSIGTLHVEPDFRRRGLAVLAVKELIRMLGSRSVNQWHVDGAGGGALGWNSVDVADGNAGAHGLFQSIEGWREGWICHWALLKALEKRE